MIDTLIKEFLAIVKYLRKSQKAYVKGDYLIAEKSVIIKLLEQNLYETVENKLIAWRGLTWIDTDPDRLTKRVRQDGKTIAAIKINIRVAETLEKWTENS